MKELRSVISYIYNIAAQPYHVTLNYLFLKHMTAKLDKQGPSPFEGYGKGDPKSA